MNGPTPILRLVPLAIAALVVVLLLRRLRGTRQLANQTADGIEDELGALDPLTRAATVARMARDAVQDARDRAGS